ncbi:MAG: efflux RND transporter permease subunit [Candidatus Binatia bacterium]|nr:efflux RND transporter permease subunit [Candidatus Binatia bacterium]
MKLAEFALNNRVTTLVLTFVVLIAGYFSFNSLARYEDPEFTIKDAVVVTRYPGASPEEVEREVTDKVEKAIQQLSQLDWIESTNYRGRSEIKLRIKDAFDKERLPQVWDELRRKVGDVQGQLPPGAGPSVVRDDFGDVYGVFVAIYGAEYSFAELKEVAKFLQRELLLVDDVAKIDFWGVWDEAVYVEPNRERMSQLGIRPTQIAEKLRAKNVVSDAGRVEVLPDYVAIRPTGEFLTVAQFENLLISEEGADEQIYLRDVATVRRGYVEPPRKILRYDGERGIGLGISTVLGGNVVNMGAGLEKRIDELQGQIPLGIEVGIISLQSAAVTTAIDGFMLNLLEAVAIVVGVLLFFMGWRSAGIIGFVLVLTIAATFIFMGPWNVALERISLGALIIALGMLVDNAIVVVDGMLVRMQKGEEGESAALAVIGQQSIPLLGATAVAIMAFAAIGLSQDSTGEYCRTLFQVVFLSLGLSWVTAVTATPILCVMFLPVAEAGGADAGRDPYGGAFYSGYRAVVAGCIRFRWVTVSVVVFLFALSLYGFGFVDQSFFPNSTRPQFMVDMFFPQGIFIEETEERSAKLENYIRDLDGVTHVSTLIGGGAMRFLLTYDPEKDNSAYVQFLVDVDDYAKIDAMLPQIEDFIARNIDGMGYTKKFRLGPGSGGRIQARIMGPDKVVLRGLAAQAEVLMEKGAGVGVRNDWRQRVKVVRPVIAEEEAERAGITRTDVAAILLSGFAGERIGVYRDGDELLPIFVRSPEPDRLDVQTVNYLQIWSPPAQGYIPLRQVISGFKTVFEDDIVWRLHRRPAITIHADPPIGETSETYLARIKGEVDALDFPPGYSIEWWGEYRDGNKAKNGIAASLPMFFVMMVLIVIGLFNALRQPLIIWLMVPLALIGVTLGLLVTGQPFGFMSLLGFMSLSGMLVKNAIVLIDEIDLQRRNGLETYQAILDSGVSRLRPVAMAALTTALGMMPLFLDDFFISMAVTIVFGLMFATVLTMVVIPVLYSIFFRASAPEAT